MFYYLKLLKNLGYFGIKIGIWIRQDPDPLVSGSAILLTLSVVRRTTKSRAISG